MPLDRRFSIVDLPLHGLRRFTLVRRAVGALIGSGFGLAVHASPGQMRWPHSGNSLANAPGGHVPTPQEIPRPAWQRGCSPRLERWSPIGLMGRNSTAAAAEKRADHSRTGPPAWWTPFTCNKGFVAVWKIA